MPNSEIQIYIEKSPNNSSWSKASGSFSNPKINIYDGSNILVETRDINYYFTDSYYTADTFHIVYNDGNIIGNSNNVYMTWDVDSKLNENIIPSYFYKLTISAVNYTSIVFNPSGFGVPTQWELNVYNPFLVPNTYFTTSSGKYWDYYNSNSNILILESEGGNFYYDRGFYQSQLNYIPSTNSRFKNGTEPSDTQFPNIVDEWKLNIGDEIRFENKESQTYIINNISWDYSISPNKLLVTLDRNIYPNTTNLNFFLIRRWKENRNNITVNQTFPYSNPLPSASLAPSTTGFIFPKYPVDAIAKNPDKIIRDLIDKKIIE